MTNLPALREAVATDEFGAVTVRVEPLAYDAWVERQRADQA
jgi:hypothetical protein